MVSRVGSIFFSGFNSVNCGSNLNNDPKYDFSKKFYEYFESQNDNDEDCNDNPYISNNLVCKFFSEPEFIKSFRECNSPIILNLNIQYLHSKFDKLRYFLEMLASEGIKIDAISLQEVSTIQNASSLTIPGYHPLIYKCRSKSKGGGVGFFVNESLKFRVKDDLSPFYERIFESLTIELFFDNSKYFLSSVYRPPGNHPTLNDSELFNSFMTSFEAHVVSLANHNSFILTDSNINLLAIDQSKHSQDFLDFMLSHGFLNLITKATRFSKNSFSLIDQIFTNLKNPPPHSGVILNDISDHLVTFTCLNLKKKINSTPKFKEYRVFSDTCISRFKNDLSNIDWTNVIDKNDANEAFNNFMDTWSFLFDLYFPLKYVKFNKNYHKKNDFMTAGLLISRLNKLSLYKKFIKSQDSADANRYKLYRNLYNSTIRAAKKLHFDQKFESNKSDPKKTWGTLNEALNRPNAKSNIINEIVVNDESFFDSNIIANKFNSFFTEVASNVAANIPCTSVKPEDYLNETDLLFELGSVTPDEILDICKHIQGKSSLDIDGVNSKLLKKVIGEVAIPLAHIFTLSFKTGIFPDRLKVARTCPVHKSGDKDNMNHYRPISCLPSISKFIEKIVFKKLYSYLSVNKFLHENQFGFQPGKSTVHPLLKIIDFISGALNDNEIAVAVFIDLRKAFDVIDHKILLSKLSKYGIKNTNLDWFASYLRNRKQFVMVNGSLSDFWSEFNISVAQGSILGPLLFLIFINDIFKVNSLINFLFADDTTGLAKGSDIHSIGTFVNNELQKLGVWLKANKLAINTDKTKVMIFHSKNKTIPHFDFKFNNNDIGGLDPSLIYPIERIHNNSKVPAFKLLGVFLDENLTFNYHFCQIRNKISKSLYSLNQAKHFLSAKALKMIYYALIHPHFLYCLPVICSTTQSNIDKLFIMQKKSLRIISQAKYNAHTLPLFFFHKILPFPDLIIFQNLLFMHSVDKEYIKVKFSDIFVKSSEILTHNYPLRNASDYHVPRVKSEYMKRFPLYNLPKTWNSLEPGFRDVNSKTLFKYNIKSHLLSKYADYKCEKLFCYVCSNS